MERHVSLLAAGVFGLVAGLWALNFYEPDAMIWTLAAAVAAVGLGSMIAGALQALDVY